MGVGALAGWHVGEAGPGQGYITHLFLESPITTITTYIPVRNMNQKKNVALTFFFFCYNVAYI